eukprot:TRINITY_DN1729_c1_g1_i1.p1 TRINITY_DN1729_c1_g1~~TRINITY_DN1729_c1_g1_i1.p1  ORF type:complete len:632 (+),score=114.80 TRINITY_DN1729_c1_g1_i1:154-2049(+)
MAEPIVVTRKASADDHLSLFKETPPLINDNAKRAWKSFQDIVNTLGCFHVRLRRYQTFAKVVGYHFKPNGHARSFGFITLIVEFGGKVFYNPSGATVVMWNSQGASSIKGHFYTDCFAVVNDEGRNPEIQLKGNPYLVKMEDLIPSGVRKGLTEWEPRVIERIDGVSPIVIAGCFVRNGRGKHDGKRKHARMVSGESGLDPPLSSVNHQHYSEQPTPARVRRNHGSSRSATTTSLQAHQGTSEHYKEEEEEEEEEDDDDRDDERETSRVAAVSRGFAGDEGADLYSFPHAHIHTHERTLSASQEQTNLGESESGEADHALSSFHGLYKLSQPEPYEPSAADMANPKHLHAVYTAGQMDSLSRRASTLDTIEVMQRQLVEPPLPAISSYRTRAEVNGDSNEAEAAYDHYGHPHSRGHNENDDDHDYEGNHQSIIAQHSYQNYQPSLPNPQQTPHNQLFSPNPIYGAQTRQHYQHPYAPQYQQQFQHQLQGPGQTGPYLQPMLGYPRPHHQQDSSALHGMDPIDHSDPRSTRDFRAARPGQNEEYMHLLTQAPLPSYPPQYPPIMLWIPSVSVPSAPINRGQMPQPPQHMMMNQHYPQPLQPDQMLAQGPIAAYSCPEGCLCPNCMQRRNSMK